MMKRTCICLVFCFSAVSLAVDFQGLGAKSVANDLSADGSVVVGSGRWTQAGGWQDIGGTANACSSDGSVVVGYREYIESWGTWEFILNKPIYWTESGGTIDIPCLGVNHAQATDVSDDGMKIVGQTSHQSNILSLYSEAFLYNRDGNSTIGLGDVDVLPGQGDYQNINSCASAISGDGSIIAGYGMPQVTTVPRAMYWTESTGMINIDYPSSPSINQGCITDISRDSATLVGYMGEPFYTHAAYWTETTGVQFLGQLDGYTDQSRPLGITDDSSTIVGWAYGSGEYAAFLWKESTGMLNLQEYLQAVYGLGLDGWTLTEATGISADGLTIVGNGINPAGIEEAWMVTIPEPASFVFFSFGTYWLCRRKRRA